MKFAAPNLLKPFNERLQKLIFKNVFLNIKIYSIYSKTKTNKTNTKRACRKQRANIVKKIMNFNY